MLGSETGKTHARAQQEQEEGGAFVGPLQSRGGKDENTNHTKSFVPRRATLISLLVRESSKIETMPLADSTRVLLLLLDEHSHLL